VVHANHGLDLPVRRNPMFKYILSVSLAVGLVSAATISTSATCDGVTTVGTDFAGCDDGHFEARAGVSSTGAGASAMFLPSSPPDFRGGGASASFSDDYVFTVTGGTGAGFFHPCVSGSAGRISDAGAGVSLGGTGVSVINPPCADTSFAFSNSAPFTFGVPQIVHYSITASANPSPLHGSAFASVTFDGIVFFDPAGNPLPNATFALVSVPEPSTWFLLGVGLIFFLSVTVIGRIAGTEK
jgi:PEP-CTERM motif